MNIYKQEAENSINNKYVITLDRFELNDLSDALFNYWSHWAIDIYEKDMEEGHTSDMEIDNQIAERLWELHKIIVKEIIVKGK